MWRNGQSLVEVLIGIGLGALFIVGAMVLIAPALQINSKVNQVQIQAALANELVGNARTLARGNWQSFSSLATSSANTYYLVASTSPFTATSGRETVTINGLSFVRYFFVSDTYRDSSGYVTSTASGNTYDPSTRQITVSINLASTTTATTTFVFYVTRNANSVFDQTDWTGGGAQNGPYTTATSTFFASTNTLYTTAGSITVNPPVSSRISLMDSNVARVNSGSSAVGASFLASPASGTLVVAAMASWNQSISSFADNQGNSYSLAVATSVPSGANTLYLSMYYAQNVSSNGGLFNVTGTASGSSGGRTVVILNYRGTATSSALDQCNAKAGSVVSTTRTSGSVTVGTDNELYLGALSWPNQDNVSSTGSFAQVSMQNDGTNYQPISVVHKVVTATTTTATWKADNADVYVGLICTFKPAS